MKSALRNCLVGVSVLGFVVSSNAQQDPAPAPPAPAVTGPVVAPPQAAGNQMGASRAKLLELRQEKSRLFRSVNELEAKLLQEKPELKEKLAKNQEEIKQLRDQERQIQEQIQKLNQARDQVMKDASPELTQAHERMAKVDEEIRAISSSPITLRPTRDRMRGRPGAVPGAAPEKPEPAPAVVPAPADKPAEAPKPPEAPKAEDPKKE